MHMCWPSMAEATPEMPGMHSPFKAESEPEPLAWDSCIPYITKNSMFSSHVKLDGLGQSSGFLAMGDLGWTDEAAVEHQGSYWPNEPPVLPPAGFYWYNYGPVGRGMNFYKTVPVGSRPTAAEQAADLVKHRANFVNDTVPDGLEQALAEHGLELPPSKIYELAHCMITVSAVLAGLGFVWELFGFKGKG